MTSSKSFNERMKTLEHHKNLLLRLSFMVFMAIMIQALYPFFLRVSEDGVSFLIIWLLIQAVPVIDVGITINQLIKTDYK